MTCLTHDPSHCLGIRRAESEPALMAGGDRRINKANLDLSDCEHYISPSLQTQQVYTVIILCACSDGMYVCVYSDKILL